VNQVPWAGLSLISAGDEEMVHGVTPATPCHKTFDCSMGQPLFWQERNTVKFWSQLLNDVDAKVVFDLTPSGRLERMCLGQGIVYPTMATNAEHSNSLQNLLDRAAMKIITKSGSPLYERGLAQCLQEHFQDVL
jgi:hypothetical protein